MENYNWPGNIRELKNIVERVAILCDSEMIEEKHLPKELSESLNPNSGYPIPCTWEELKKLIL